MNTAGLQLSFDRVRLGFLPVLALIVLAPHLLFVTQAAIGSAIGGMDDAAVRGVLLRAVLSCVVLVAFVDADLRRGFRRTATRWNPERGLRGSAFIWIRGVLFRFALLYVGLHAFSLHVLVQELTAATGQALAPEVALVPAALGALALLLYVVIPVYLTFELLLGRNIGAALVRGSLTTARTRALLTGPAVTLNVGGGLLATVLYTSGEASAELVFALATLVAYGLLMAVLDDRIRSAAVAPFRALARAADGTLPSSVGAVDEIAALARELVDARAQAEQADHALRDRERRFREIAEVASDWFYELGPDLRLTWISVNARELSGAASAPQPGTSVHDMMRPFSGPDVERYFAAIEAHEAFSDLVLSWRTEGGGSRHISTRGRPRFDETGAFEGYVGTARDVTDRIEAQRSLRERSEELARVQRVQAVGELTSGVAHDFNNLLTAVSGNLELARDELCEDAPEREELDRWLHEASDAALRGSDLVARLLGLVRRAEHEPERLDAGAVVERLAPLLRSALGGRCVLELDLEPGVSCHADAVQLENALLNLVINARDAMDGTGRVRVRTRHDGEHGCALIEVSDSGPGVPAHLREQIFDAFFTTKGQDSGTGLGLSTVRSFAQQTGGGIELDDAPEGGACFRLRLPATSRRVPAQNSVADAALADDAPPSAADVEPRRTMPLEPRVSAASSVDGARTVFLVEDQDPIRHLLVKQLERLGFRVRPFADPDEALAALAAAPSADLLLTDVVLGARIDGIELADAVGDSHPALPVVFMTGYTERRGEMGAATCLDKPFGFDDLARAVDDVFAAAA